MSWCKNDNTNPMRSTDNTKHKSQILFKTRYGVVSIIDLDSIKRFQIKSGVKANGKLNAETKAALIKYLLDPSDIEALDKAIPIRVKRASGTSTQEAIDFVEHIIRESESF